MEFNGPLPPPKWRWLVFVCSIIQPLIQKCMHVHYIDVLETNNEVHNAKKMRLLVWATLFQVLTRPHGPYDLPMQSKNKTLLFFFFTTHQPC